MITETFYIIIIYSMKIQRNFMDSKHKKTKAMHIAQKK